MDKNGMLDFLDFLKSAYNPENLFTLDNNKIMQDYHGRQDRRNPAVEAAGSDRAKMNMSDALFGPGEYRKMELEYGKAKK